MASRSQAVPLRPAPPVDVPGDRRLRAELCRYLAGFISERRLQQMEKVLSQRTRWITTALEEIYQPHNASAVLRTCDCFGVQDVHIVEARNEYTVHRAVAQGAAKWLDLHRYGGDDTRQAVEQCCATLKGRGYRLLAATPHEDALPLDAVDVARGPVAVLFGTELEGLTPAAMAHVEQAVRIPTVGFSASLNVSVSAALILRQLTTALRARRDIDWRLRGQERDELRLEWLRRSMRHGEALVRRFLEQHRLPPADGSPAEPIHPGVEGAGKADRAGGG